MKTNYITYANDSTNKAIIFFAKVNAGVITFVVHTFSLSGDDARDTTKT